MGPSNYCGYVCVSCATLIAAASGFFPADVLLLACYAAAMVMLLAAVSEACAMQIATAVGIVVGLSASAAYPAADYTKKAVAHTVFLSLLGGAALICAEPKEPPSAPQEPPTAEKPTQCPA